MRKKGAAGVGGVIKIPTCVPGGLMGWGAVLKSGKDKQRNTSLQRGITSRGKGSDAEERHRGKRVSFKFRGEGRLEAETKTVNTEKRCDIPLKEEF